MDNIVELNNSYTYEELTLLMKKISSSYAPVTAIEDIGETHQKRPVYAIHLGKGNRSFLYLAGVHGCENINPIVMLKIIEHYALKKLVLDDCRMIFIPVVNPDGYEYARLSKTMYRGNAKQIDINRNFGCKSYKGKTPDSEPETRAVINVCREYEPEIMIDFHSRGNSCFYYRNAMNDEYNRNNLRIAQIIAKVTGYALEKPENENPDGLGGNTVQFFSEKYNKPAITIETVNENEDYPLDVRLQQSVYERIVNVPLIAACVGSEFSEKCIEPEQT